MINTALICILLICITFTIYLLKLYLSKSKKKPFSNNVILFLLITCIIYIIFISWFIKLPSYKSYYIYSCFPVRIIPLPKQNELRCSDVILFNLTSPLTPNHVLNVKPKLIYSSMIIYNNNTIPCLFQQNTMFLYYCMEYGTNDNILYYMLAKSPGIVN
jgi:hypothetical protein